MKDFIKSLTNEELAVMVRGLITTGLSITTIEKDVLYEAAERIEQENLCDHCKHFERCEHDERKFWQTGEWIESDSDDPCWYMCSKCHRQSDNKEKFCPSCGARMYDPQESEE